LCGIIGYVGDQKASPLLYEALKRMEYRGYDSAGIATFDDAFIIKKGVGKIKQLDEKLNFVEMQGTVGMGHTRWATHGGVTEENAHPHWSCRGEVVIAHNGIVENYSGLKSFLADRGHKFRSSTDSEIIAHLIEEALRNHKDIESAILSVVASLRGSYAFVAMVRSSPNMILGVRKEAPLIIGVGQGENFLSSDVLGFIDKTNQAIFLDNKEIVLATKDSLRFFDFNGKPVEKKPTTVAWELSDISKKEFLHFTLKEIHEQPIAIRQTLGQSEEEIEEFADVLRSTKNLFITACGTSFHAALLMKYMLARKAKIRAEVFLSSEIGQQKYLMDDESVLLAISQSGETADVLSAVLESKSRGVKVLSVANVMGSSLARESLKTIYTRCGPEVGVAATKSFTSQVALLYMIALSAGGDYSSLRELRSMRIDQGQMLTLEKTVQNVAEKYKEANDFYFVGRGDHFPIALEGALKLKELSYVHAEGMAAGELKHGTLALIEEGTPVVLINPPDETYAHTLNNAMELKARGAKIIGISSMPQSCYDDYIPIPKQSANFLYPIFECIPLQMLAYFTATARKLDPDYPRNLAKSVTVI
jgi:glucosamine--fructose-6-phosphate aminotransferase (isomerizing)